MTSSTSTYANSSAVPATNHTPVDVRPRRMDFPFGELKDRYFFDDNLLKSVYIAALSATFPGGEAEFIKSVRFYQDQIEDPEMQKQIRGFIGQEAHHSQQHQAFNRALKPLGFDVPRLEKAFEKDLEWSIKNRSERQRLAFTVCLEHQTAILADEFLTNPKVLQGMDEPIAQLLRWHAVEEIEHKGVAFDVFMQCVGDRELLHKAQRMATVIFTYRTVKYMIKLLWWARKRPKFRDIKGFFKFMFGKGGLLKNLRAPYKDFFREDFHPWDHKNQALVEEWKLNSYSAEYDKGSPSYKAPQAA